MVPETLLKKRKSQEKEREARASDLQKKRAVSHTLPLCPVLPVGFVVMIFTQPRLDLRVDVVVVNHLSGLSDTLRNTGQFD